jgi:hypothetical protein
MNYAKLKHIVAEHGPSTDPSLEPKTSCIYVPIWMLSTKQNNNM